MVNFPNAPEYLSAIPYKNSSRRLEHSPHKPHGDDKATYHKYLLEMKIMFRHNIVFSVHTKPVNQLQTTEIFFALIRGREYFNSKIPGSPGLKTNFMFHSKLLAAKPYIDISRGRWLKKKILNDIFEDKLQIINFLRIYHENQTARIER